MEIYGAIGGLLPLVLFVLVDSFASLRAALIVAVVASLGEAIFSLYYFGHIDWITGASFFFVAILGFFSWKHQNPRFFYWQPAIISWGIALYVGGLKILGGRDFLLDMATKYAHLLLSQGHLQQIQHPLFQEMLRAMSITLPVAFILHGAVVLLTAYKLNKWWWIVARGVGLYLFLILSALVAKNLALARFEGLHQ